MKRLVLFLAFFLVASAAGCPNNNNEDINDVITRGTWRVSYYINNGDEDTTLFYGYVFTFKTDGTVSVTRPNLPVAPGTWNEHDNNTRLDLDFGNAGLLERLNEDWFVYEVDDDEILMNEPGRPLNQCELSRIY